MGGARAWGLAAGEDVEAAVRKVVERAGVQVQGRAGSGPVGRGRVVPGGNAGGCGCRGGPRMRMEGAV